MAAAQGLRGGALASAARVGAALGDLKRVRDARSPDSLATRGFRLAWSQVTAGCDMRALALGATADALAATCLGGIDGEILEEAGVAGGDDILERALLQASMHLDTSLPALLRPCLDLRPAHGTAPAFAEALIRQPRAGATRPGRPRVILEPPENHGDHCFVVATLGVVLCPYFAADPATVFCAGLAHHLHNAVVPDSGYAGEMMLGDALAPMMARLFARTLETLPAHAADAVRAGLSTIGDADTPEGRAFHAADVLDRVLQMQHYEEVASFTTRRALDDLDLVHGGPVQAFHRSVLREAGLA